MLHCLTRVNPSFASEVSPGDFVGGGRNFGIGLSREQAAQALHHLGVAAVIAPSFGGIVYRNALNFGFLVVEYPDAGRIAHGDKLTLDPIKGEVGNLTSGQRYSCRRVPGHLLEIVQAGGLVPYLEASRR